MPKIVEVRFLRLYYINIVEYSTKTFTVLKNNAMCLIRVASTLCRH